MTSRQLYAVLYERNWTLPDSKAQITVLVQWKGVQYQSSNQWSWTGFGKRSNQSPQEIELRKSLLQSAPSLIQQWHDQVEDVWSEGGLRCSSAVVGSFSNKNSSCWAFQLLSVVAYNTSGLVALNALLGPHGRSSFGSAVMKAVSSIPTAFWQGSPSAKETVAANQIVQDFMQHCSNLSYALSRIPYSLGDFASFSDSWSLWRQQSNAAEAFSTCALLCQELYQCSPEQCVEIDNLVPVVRIQRRMLFTAAAGEGTDLVDLAQQTIQQVCEGPTPKTCSKCQERTKFSQTVACLLPSVLKVEIDVHNEIGGSTTGPHGTIGLNQTIKLCEFNKHSHFTADGGLPETWVEYSLQSVVFFGNCLPNGKLCGHFWGCHKAGEDEWVFTDDVGCSASGSLVQPSLVTHTILSANSHSFIMNKASADCYRNTPLLNLPRGAAVTVVETGSYCNLHPSATVCKAASCPMHLLTRVRTDGGTIGFVMSSSLTDTRAVLSRFSVDPLHSDVQNVSLFFQRLPTCSLDSEKPTQRSEAWAFLLNKSIDADSAVGVCDGIETAETLAFPHLELNEQDVSLIMENHSEDSELSAWLFTSCAVKDFYLPADKAFDNELELRKPVSDRTGYSLRGRMLVRDTQAQLLLSEPNFTTLATAEWMAHIGDQTLMVTKLAQELAVFLQHYSYARPADAGARTLLFVHGARRCV